MVGKMGEMISVGDRIEAINTLVAIYPMRGKVIELDLHPLEHGRALIELDSPALPAPNYG
jgi:hypothetical protein